MNANGENAVLDTLEYYEANAGAFIQGTRDVDFQEIQQRFLSLLPEGSRILDFGCGSGRDTKYFLERGYQVDAVDGSEEICLQATEYTGIVVRQMLFTELDEDALYDGIWACASILHVEKRDLLSVFNKMKRALKEGGILYTSFKYGSGEGMRKGRYFTDFTKESFRDFLGGMTGFRLEECWITGDVREGRSDEGWLNILLRKCEG